MSDFVNLHTHSEYSPLDGLSTIQEIVDQAVADEQMALAITDHGVCSGHPELSRVAKKAGIKPIFGLEAYFSTDRTLRALSIPDYNGEPDGVYEEEVERVKEENARRRDYNHLILLAKTNQGLKNLWAVSTESYRTGFYRYPRSDWALLEQYHDGLIVSSGCLRGPIARAILEDDEDKAVALMSRFLNIFKDDFYLELHTNPLSDQIKVNTALAEMSQRFGVPTLAVVDSHYPTKEAVHDHKAWMACATSTDVQDETGLFETDLGAYVQSEAEARANLAYLPDSIVNDAVWNTLKVAADCNASIGASTVTPTYSKEGGQDRDAERLLEVCMANWERKTVGKRETQEVYIARFEREFKMLVEKGFCGYFLYVWDYVKYAKDNGVLVGPGRGSGGGSLVAYLTDITEIDPVEARLLFERFMTEGRTALPDFDVDFPASKRDFMQDYLTNKYGKDYVIRVGTHLRLKNKGTVQNLFRSLKSTFADPEEAYNDSRKVAAIIEEAEAGTAGLGMSWDDLWVQHEEELMPFRRKYPQVFSLADQFVGRLKSYGKHAAGLVISSDEPLTGSLPLRGSEDEGQMISQFEMADLEAQGKVKFDLLTLRTLDTLQMCIDLIEQGTGKRINVYDWTEADYSDPLVFDEMARGHTLGMFQIETTSMTRLVKRMAPANIAEMADAITLVRPGPMRSGLTETYFRRRAGQEEVLYQHPLLADVLKDTYGTMLYQEDIMAVTMVLAGYDSNKADEVRKILGKKQVEKVAEAGKEFIAGCAANGIMVETAEHLWEQMAEFAKYSFNRAHAYAYAILGYWTAWFKVHYPQEFLVAALSTVDDERIPEFVQESRRIGYFVLPPDINESGRGFKATNPSTIRYGLDAIKGIGDAVVAAILPGQPYASFEDFLEYKGAACNAGHIRTLAKVGAFDTLTPFRKGLVTRLEEEANGISTECTFKNKVVGDQVFVPVGNVKCTFDWDSLEPILGRTGKPLKDQSKVQPPKRCTKACRQYLAPDPLDITKVAHYTDAEVMAIETEYLGTYLTVTPFDRLPKEYLHHCLTAEDLDDAPEGGPHLIAALVTKVRPHVTKGGKRMGFLGLLAQTSEIDVVSFTKTWDRYGPSLHVGLLCLAEVEKKRRDGEWSYNLTSFTPI